MMNPTECAKAWQAVINIYNNTRDTSPEITMKHILDVFGIKKTKEIFATIATIKEHDGRIYGANREYMKSVPVNPESVERVHGNPMLNAGLDDIHTTHINQLITELRKVEK